MAFQEVAVLKSDQAIKAREWHRQDTIWMLSLYGTAIGAGTLFLPIDAGLHGFLPLCIMLVLAFPMTYFSHRALTHFVLSGSANKDITQVVDEHFGRITGTLLTFCYFFAIYPILLLYSVAITNTTQSFLIHQLGLNAPPRGILAICLILSLMTIIRYGQAIIVRAMSLLVFPFVAILMFLALYLIPFWQGAIFTAASANSPEQSLLTTIWLMIPVMVFSFNHTPIISSFAVSQKDMYGKEAATKTAWILKNSHLMMVTTVMFFVFSCVLSLTPGDLAQAKQQNISILSYLANHFATPTIAYMAPIIAFIAIAKSFLGHYLGAKEGMQGLILKYLPHRSTQHKQYVNRFIEVFIVVTCWLAATLNPSILGMIESLGGPIIAVILFLMPVYAMTTVPAMQRYQSSRIVKIFITLLGLIAISAIFYGLLHF